MLMDHAITLGLKKQELSIDLNLVRIFLGVITVSDICHSQWMDLSCTFYLEKCSDPRQSQLHHLCQTGAAD